LKKLIWDVISLSLWLYECFAICTELQQQIQELVAVKEKQEREFGEGRAKLKQLYMQKEGL